MPIVSVFIIICILASYDIWAVFGFCVNQSLEIQYETEINLPDVYKSRHMMLLGHIDLNPLKKLNMGKNITVTSVGPLALTNDKIYGLSNVNGPASRPL